jgi:HK97 family phage major capsid protein
MSEEWGDDPLPAHVQRQWDANHRWLEDCERQLAEIERRTARVRHLGGRRGSQERNDYLPGPDREGRIRPIHYGQDDASHWVDRDGHEVRVLKYGERMRVLDRGGQSGPPLSWRKYLRGILTGRWNGAEAERSMVEGTQSAGGYLVPTPLSDQVIDRARNATVVMRAGAQTVPMDAATLYVARVTGDPVQQWHTEASAVTPADMTFDRVTFTARTLVALATLSVELAEDAANADEVVADAIAKVLAIELDRACLRGSGIAPEPTGIRNQTGVGLDTTMFGTNGSAISGTTPTGAVAWDWLSKTIFTVRGLNEYPNAAIMSERTLGELDLLRSSTGAPLAPPISVAGVDEAEDATPGSAYSAYGQGRGIALLSTNSVLNTITQGTANTASTAYVGDFTKLLIGLRRDLVLEVSRTAGLPSGVSAFGNLLVAIRAYMRADVQLQRPAAFRVVEGIL